MQHSEHSETLQNCLFSHHPLPQSPELKGRRVREGGGGGGEGTDRGREGRGGERGGKAMCERSIWGEGRGEIGREGGEM